MHPSGNNRTGRPWSNAVRTGLLALTASLPLYSHLTAADIFMAAEKGDLPALKQAVETGGNPTAALAQKNTAGWTPLMVATRFGKRDAVTYLLDQKADLDADGGTGWTPLLLATKYTQNATAQILIDRKADLNRRAPDGNYPLHLALFNDNADLTRALAAAGARLNVYGADARSVLYMAVEADDPDLKLIALLLDKGAEPDLGCTLATDSRGGASLALSPLHRAVINGKLNIVKLLIEHGADPENLAFAMPSRRERTLNGLSALALAVRSKQTKIVAYLAANGANPNLIPGDGINLIESALRWNSLEMLQALLENHADPNLPNSDNETPLAALKEMEERGTEIQPQLVDLLKKHGGKESIEGTASGQSRLNQTAAVQYLKVLATAQAQFIKKMDFYSTNGTQLNTTGTLIPADLKNAFEGYLDNGDSATPAPKAGYIYRMLQGDQESPTSFRKDAKDPAAGMNTWAATARSAEPGVSGNWQYVITEAGTVYKHAEPGKADPNYKKFILTTMPPVFDEAALTAAGWTTAK